MASSPRAPSAARIFGRHEPQQPFARKQSPSSSATDSPSVDPARPAISSMSQVAFPPHDSDFMKRFRATQQHHVRMHDSESEYREQVFQVGAAPSSRDPALSATARSLAFVENADE
jgi:hypothetical protein